MPPTPPSSTFAERLLLHRTKAGLTQEGLADRVMVGQSTIHRWEAGDSSPDIAELLRLCEFFRVTPNYMTGYSDTPTGLWADQFLTNEDLIEHMRADPRAEGVPIWKVPRRHRVIELDEAIRIQRELKLDT